MVHKYNDIYNKLQPQKQSRTNDFDLFRSVKEQHQVEIRHVFEFDKAWELVQRDPK